MASRDEVSPPHVSSSRPGQMNTSSSKGRMMNWETVEKVGAEGNWPLARTESVDRGAVAAAADEGGQMEQRQRPRDGRKGG